MAAEPRLRPYLTRAEVAQLLRAAKQSRHGRRNHAMILLAHRHGLRACELVQLRWGDVDLARGMIYCHRAKNSRSSVHPLKRDEALALEQLLRQGETKGEFVFPSERGERLSPSAFWRVVAAAGERAGLPVKTYAHLLRHSCGYYLANKSCDLRIIWATSRSRTRCVTRHSVWRDSPAFGESGCARRRAAWPRRAWWVDYKRRRQPGR